MSSNTDHNAALSIAELMIMLDYHDRAGCLGRDGVRGSAAEDPPYR